METTKQIHTQFKVKFTIAFLFCVSLLASKAEGAYLCHIKANPAQGFLKEVDILIPSTTVEGKVYLIENNNKRLLGYINSIVTLDRSSPSDAQEFQNTLTKISEESSSGLKRERLHQVQEITKITARNLEGTETISILQLFDLFRQIGGSVQISEQITSCLP